ncbi:MAG: GFA family protein [Acidimicrobiales bacterium]|nr:GFA family protein [Acidimicrobiales bacterium]MYB82513.1 GFA family protein [Acidimicrobiales bacterium]MYI12813.1 GFA family protein [Acidimicrobiales bacterium]
MMAGLRRTAMSEAAESVSRPAASGHCLCGAVSYEVHGPIRQVWNCHCWRCRRWTGHHMAATGCKGADLRLISDASLAWYHPADDPNVAYGFCRECGASLFWKVGKGKAHQSDTIAICAGTLDLPSGLHTELAIFTDDAADYHTLDPAVPTRGGE